MAGTYRCPVCQDSEETIADLKRHMSSYHGGFSDDDIRAASGSGAEAMFASGEESFEQFAGTLPEDANDLLLDPPPTEQEVARKQKVVEEKEAKTARVAMSKKMKKKMAEFKAKLSETLPQLFFHRQAEKYQQPGWELTKDEKEAIKDSFETALDILDVEFAFQPIEIQLTSIWWVLAYPVVIFGTIFLMKQADNPAPSEEEKQ